MNLSQLADGDLPVPASVVRLWLFTGQQPVQAIVL